MIRNKRSLKFIAQGLLYAFLIQLLTPSTALALTGGPSQPEVNSFTPAGTNNMVDPFTGDFGYNIPLLDVGGYPINLSYSANLSMDQEASWVGLGWNLNAGVITRNLRGIPDDFDGDEIVTEMNMKTNYTYTYRPELGFEIFGFDTKKLTDAITGGYSVGVLYKYNNYRGLSIDLSGGSSISAKLAKSGQHWGTTGLGFNFLNSKENGLDINPTVSFSGIMNDATLGLSVAYNANDRMGYKALTGSIGGSQEIWGATVPLGIGGRISLSPNTYTPQVEMPMLSINSSSRFKIGAATTGTLKSANLSGTFSMQQLTEKVKSTPSFGYTKLEQGISVNHSILDFNREKDKPFDKYTSNLPVTNLTYDLFSVSGQGLTGMFRSFRSEVGYVRDAQNQNINLSHNLGNEFGAAYLTHVGADVGGGVVLSESGMWDDKNNATSLGYTQPVTDSDTEPYYFAMVGDPAIDSKSADGSSIQPWYRSAVHGKEALRVDLTGADYDVEASSTFAKNDHSTHSFSSIKREHRRSRTQHVASYSIKELKDYSAAGGYYAGLTDVNNLGSTVAKDHHIGQFTVTKTDGTRYVYGIPVYNHLSKDVSFNVSGNSRDCLKGFVHYKAKDASVENDLGQDHFFQANTVPSHAHSFLITEILSADYSDYDAVPGPSIGDLGTYYKFQYKTVANYKWRVPYANFQASFDPGLHSKAYDDRGHYSYGEKELKYLTRIDSKTHVAIFHSDYQRQDGKGVKGEEGGYSANAASMARLTKISLYTREDYDANGANARPIKEVHFEYDYSLCQGVDNNPSGNGKLTLTKIYFTYGDSYKGKMNPYIFSYGDLNHDGNPNNDGANPNYDMKAYDRWGNYSPNQVGACDVSDGLNRSSYPYTDQDKSLADQYAAAWTLTDIQTPSGGVIRIDYESDEYRFVQNRRAKTMVPVLGAGMNTSDYPTAMNNILYDKKVPAKYFFIDTQVLDSDDNVDSLRQKFFSDIDENPIRFKFLMQFPRFSNSKYDEEFVEGYFRAVSIGFVPGQGNDFAYIEVQPVKPDDNDSDPSNAHPISVTTWNYIRKVNPDLAFSSSPKNDNPSPGEIGMGAIKDVFIELFDSFKTLTERIIGPNKSLRLKERGQKFVTGSSWLRLDAPQKGKFGGGNRVKRIVISDEWDNMVGGNAASYGQEYTYTLENGRSSGVAAAEPNIGGEENPFKMPALARKENSHLFENEDYLLAPGRYQEGPLGESFMPSPQVGYRRVVIKDIIPSNARQHATGKVVKEFYTARDFPTKFIQTGLEVQHRPPSILSSILNFSTKEHMTTGQGYAIICNDMHGKPKSEMIFAEGQDKAQSGVEFHYKTGRLGLNNQVKVLHDHNLISENLEKGVEYDLVNDFRRSYTRSYSAGLHTNFETFVIPAVPPIPLFVPVLIPSYSQNKSLYRSVVTTKVVNEYGILKETVVHNEEATSKTENLLWDEESGQVVLAKVNDKFDEEVYSFKLPAHYAYPSMGGDYQNQGYQLNDVSLEEAKPFITELEAEFDKFHPGDEVLIKPDAASGLSILRAWVIEGQHQVSGSDVKAYFLIDKEGYPIPTGTTTNGHTMTSLYHNYDLVDTDIQIINSGYGNISAVAGSASFKGDPIISHPFLLANTLDLSQENQIKNELIAAGATTYSDEWQGLYNLDPVEGSPGFTGYDIEKNTSLEADWDHILEKLIKYFAENDGFNQTNGQAVYSESDLINNSALSATEFNKLCTNLFGCENELFDKSIKFLGTGPGFSTTEVMVDLEWKLEQGFLGTEAPVFHIKFSRNGCVGLHMSLVTNFCASEFNLTNGEITEINPSYEITGLASFSSSVQFATGAVFYQTRPYPANGDAEKYRTVQLNGQFNRAGTPTNASCITDDPNDIYNGYNDLNVPQLDNAFRVGNGPTIGKYGIIRQLKTHDLNLITNPTQLGLSSFYNPYVSNARGIWRPKSQYTPLQKRSENDRIRNSGTFGTQFFWQFSSAMGWAQSGGSNWVSSGELTKHHPEGKSVESEDALGIRSSNNLDAEHYVKGQGQNAAYGQILSLDFEEYSYEEDNGLESHQANSYFTYAENSSIPSLLSADAKHTGKSSLLIVPGDLLLSETYAPQYFSYNQISQRTVQYVYPQLDRERLPTFLQVEKQLGESQTEVYVLSYWLKSASETLLNPSDFEIEIQNSFGPPGTGINFINPYTPSNGSAIRFYPPVNGWQRVEQYFEVDPNAASNVETLKIFLKNKQASGTSNNVYIDDLRFFPLKGSMIAYVYDKVTGRLMAQLDANNYATFYEYDKEGLLVRLKKETYQGIQTIQENRQNLLK
jgi:hypothetical protein